MSLWRVLRQSQRFAGPWRTAFIGPEGGAKKCYHDLLGRRQRGNVVLCRGQQLIAWARRPTSPTTTKGTTP
jgi:hypothetical protein